MSHGLHDTHLTDRPWTLDPRRDYLTYLPVKPAKKILNLDEDRRARAAKIEAEHKSREDAAITKAKAIAGQDVAKILAITTALLALIAAARNV